jgi:calcineurin-like phosphoesterase family protein
LEADSEEKMKRPEDETNKGKKVQLKKFSRKRASREWFTSDHHFNHDNVIEFSKRPFENVEVMNEALIENWNKYVKPEDTVYVLGDFCFKKADRERFNMFNILKRLNGTKVLVIGNHDYSKNHMYQCGFDVVVRYATVDLGKNMRVFLSHKPYRCSIWWKWWTKWTRGWKHKDWRTRPKNRGMINVHGHTHSDKKLSKSGICVCVEAWDYRPANATEIVQLIQKFDLKGEL